VDEDVEEDAEDAAPTFFLNIMLMSMVCVIKSLLFSSLRSVFETLLIGDNNHNVGGCWNTVVTYSTARVEVERER